MQQDLECIYKSFDGCGSIYMAIFPTHKIQTHLNRYGIRAAVDLSPQHQLKPEFPGQLLILRLPTQDSQALDLKKPLQMCFQFISKNKAKTNILICGYKKTLCLTFLFAYLMKNYHYNLAYIFKLFEHNIKNISFPTKILEQLKRISMQFQADREDEDDPELMDSKIGRRIKRIRYEYPNLAKSSRGSSRSSADEKQSNYQTVRPQLFTPVPKKLQMGMIETNSALPLKSKSRHVKRLSDYY